MRVGARRWVLYQLLIHLYRCSFKLLFLWCRKSRRCPLYPLKRFVGSAVRVLVEFLDLILLANMSQVSKTVFRPEKESAALGVSPSAIGFSIRSYAVSMIMSRESNITYSCSRSHYAIVERTP